MAEISIRVVNKDGYALKGIPVMVDYGGFNGYREDWTDDEGWVTFDAPRDYYGFTLFIDGDEYGQHEYSAGDTFSFILED